MSEKRRHMRFNLFLEALCRKGGIPKKLKVDNFSREGIGISSDELLNEGDDVEIEMMIPGDNIPVVVTGQIAWTEKTKEDANFKSGVKLTRINNADRGKILNYIYQKWMAPKKDGEKE
ncbi:MAG TPA: PilZ domain-containing protein [Candidatus Omnitrophota bacterium]|nr:PilZ domain-containing protein [Candidatus Omnitrophota bacterium]HPS20834.1 PilZ domain-containing protein [Candidatus Omnitrophota bacterium]